MDRMFRKRFGEQLAKSFFIIMIFVLMIFELTTILPFLIENNFRFISFHICMALFLFFNTLSNLYKIIHTSTSIIGIVMPSIMLPQWHYCYVCETNVPPRSFHCDICNRCILRRDHHCIFTGKDKIKKKLINLI